MRDVKAPLLMEEMQRSVFETRLADDPRNDYLLSEPQPETKPIPQFSIVPEDDGDGFYIWDNAADDYYQDEAGLIHHFEDEGTAEIFLEALNEHTREIQPEVSAEASSYGYDFTDMEQLDRQEALQLFDEGELIYLCYPDATEAAAESREEIEAFDGLFAMDKESEEIITENVPVDIHEQEEALFVPVWKKQPVKTDFDALPRGERHNFDEQALSYAEVKALAVDNPYIMEKMTLDVEASRLKLVKANFLSQKYALEDKLLKHYPREIRLMTERAESYAADIERYEQHKTADFPGMTLLGNHFAEKKDAGAELVAICKAQTSPELAEIGEYRGFALLVSYDVFAKTFRLTMKGTASHTIDLGADGSGNILRIENALEKLPERRDRCLKSIEELKMQMESAKAEIAKPFEKEAELAEKTERLAKLDALLSMDKRSSESIDVMPEEHEERSPRCVGMER